MYSRHGWPSRGLKGGPGWVLFCSGSTAPLTLPTEAQDLDAIFMDTKFSSKVSGSFEKDKGVYLRLKINRDMAGTLPTAGALPSNVRFRFNVRKSVLLRCIMLLPCTSLGL